MKSKSQEPEASSIIFGSSVLSNLAPAQVLEILPRLYTDRAFVAKAVQHEIQAGISNTSTSVRLQNRKLRAINQALDDGWLQTPPDEINPNDDAVELRLTLEYGKKFSAGESETMAIARNRNWVFASDDGIVRQFAKERGIRLTGTLGILVKAVQYKIICSSLADFIHSRMIDKGYRSPLSYKNGISNYQSRIQHLAAK
ncbi:putative nucleic acid-binding protein, contains PIN domain [Rivularia sp. PCC 7116]|uniref:nucleic acid-binding protein n=1 Tax=Rivularia sp. PCC 7116 TaxID=373994 RepID=UPI00029ECF78|nr:nucleic acid-binding protein [Rivularia sp. PCC 7116]AFY57395.1 putative nucleic acid-binding protein, contains PIN domain [Rivularia sp. PCC 7116]